MFLGVNMMRMWSYGLEWNCVWVLFGVLAQGCMEERGQVFRG